MPLDGASDVGAGESPAERPRLRRTAPTVPRLRAQGAPAPHEPRVPVRKHYHGSARAPRQAGPATGYARAELPARRPRGSPPAEQGRPGAAARPPGASASGRLRRSSGPRRPGGAEEGQSARGSRPPVGLVTRGTTAATYHRQIAAAVRARAAPEAWPSSAGCPSTAVPAEERAGDEQEGHEHQTSLPIQDARQPMPPAPPQSASNANEAPACRAGQRGDPERAERLAPPRAR